MKISQPRNYRKQLIVSKCRNCDIGIHAYLKKQMYCKACARWFQDSNLTEATTQLLTQLKGGT